MKTYTFKEIKPELIKFFQETDFNFGDQAKYSTALIEQMRKNCLRRLNQREPDLIEIRDLIEGYKFANKSQMGESYVMFRNSGKEINSFVKI